VGKKRGEIEILIGEREQSFSNTDGILKFAILKGG
jgi:hypothetical protein